MPRKMRSLGLTVFCCIVLSMGLLHAPTSSDAFEITIQVSPSTLNIGSDGEVVTVHTDIAYKIVVGASVYLNGVPISWWKADNQGNFVAKFDMIEVEELAASGGLEVPGENELTLVGFTNDGVEFTGTETITVINVQPSGRK